MEQYRKQAKSDREAKVRRMGGGSPMPTKDELKHPDPMAMMSPMKKARGGSAAKAKSSRKSPKTQVNVVIPRSAAGAASPVGAGVGPDGVLRPSEPAPAGLGAMASPLKKGGSARRAHGGRATKHSLDAGAGSGEGRLEKIGRKP
jgi:hypothetical protein